MESNEDEVDERPDGSLKKILKSLDQHRENMSVLETSRETGESQVLKIDCLFECVVVDLEQNGYLDRYTKLHKRERDRIVS
jgi:hypothetical protein